MTDDEPRSGHEIFVKFSWRVNVYGSFPGRESI